MVRQLVVRRILGEPCVYLGDETDDEYLGELGYCDHKIPDDLIGQYEALIQEEIEAARDDRAAARLRRDEYFANVVGR